MSYPHVDLPKFCCASANFINYEKEKKRNEKFSNKLYRLCFRKLLKVKKPSYLKKVFHERGKIVVGMKRCLIDPNGFYRFTSNFMEQ